MKKHPSNDWRNNDWVVGFPILILFIITVIFFELRGKRNRLGIEMNSVAVVAETEGCNKNARSSLYMLYYKYEYKQVAYHGSTFFDKGKRGNICYKSYFLVKLDSINPENSIIFLDSCVKVTY